MVKTYLKEYNEEFDNRIKPLEVLDVKTNSIALEYRMLEDGEFKHIVKFCSIYKLRYEIFNSHGYLYVTITKL